MNSRRPESATAIDATGGPGGLGTSATRGPAVSAPPAPATPAVERARRAPSLAERLLDGSGNGVLACDERGVVRSVNAAARELLPSVRDGEILADRLPALTDPGAGAEVELRSAGRSLVARRQPLPEGWTAWHVQDMTEQRDRLDNLLAERTRSRFLATASRRLGLSLHPGRTARSVVELAAGPLADAAVVVTPAPGGRAHWYGCLHREVVDSGQVAARELPEPVLRALAGGDAGATPLLVEELARAPWTVTTARADARAAAVVTLPGNGHPAGALVLLRRGGNPGDDDTSPAGWDPAGLDAALAEEFAQRAGLAIAAARLYAAQAHTAALLTHTLEQPELPTVPGITLGAAYRPAELGLLIGGDFYHVMPPDRLSPGETMFLLGDVCGKGVPAAVSTGQFRQSVQALRQLERDPVRILELVNSTMIESDGHDGIPRFVTAVLGAATPLDEGGLRLRLAGGGHQPPVLVRAGGVEEVEIGGMLLGAVEEGRFRSQEVILAPGESCVLYTDGITEARGGPGGHEVFGEERLFELLDGCQVMPARAIAERIVRHASRWQPDGGSDDMAVLVVQAPMPARPPRNARALGHPDPRPESGV